MGDSFSKSNMVIFGKYVLEALLAGFRIRQVSTSNTNCMVEYFHGAKPQFPNTSGDKSCYYFFQRTLIEWSELTVKVVAGLQNTCNFPQ
tara:strand:+ start:69 stop:335 length:267 start_codon:yes stop_codon:yes gene_type:complete